MYKSVIILYLIVFVTYILFSRQPDFFDGEIVPATIHWNKNSNNKRIPQATFTVNKKNYYVDARYLLRSLPEGKPLQIIYESEHPQKAAVYSFWGYWITWGELIGSVVLLIAMMEIAKAVTKNPTAESVVEQMDYKPEKKRRYED